MDTLFVLSGDYPMRDYLASLCTTQCHILAWGVCTNTHCGWAQPSSIASWWLGRADPSLDVHPCLHCSNNHQTLCSKSWMETHIRVFQTDDHFLKQPPLHSKSATTADDTIPWLIASHTSSNAWSCWRRGRQKCGPFSAGTRSPALCAAGGYVCAFQVVLGVCVSAMCRV